MKKLLLAVVAFAVMTAGATAAFGQTQISLSASNQFIDFSGTGGGNPVNVSFGCASDGTACTGTLSGNAFGDGAFLGDNGTYTIVSHGAYTLTTTATPGTFNVNGSAMDFSFAGSTGSLSGSLNLLTLQQTTGLVQGQFNTLGVANLSISSATGILAGAFGSGAITQVTIDFCSSSHPCSGDISSLFSVGGNEVAQVSVGSVVPTPEPASLAMLGSGLLAAGGFLRRKNRTLVS